MEWGDVRFHIVSKCWGIIYALFWGRSDTVVQLSRRSLWGDFMGWSGRFKHLAFRLLLQRRTHHMVAVIQHRSAIPSSRSKWYIHGLAFVDARAHNNRLDPSGNGCNIDSKTQNRKDGQLECTSDAAS